MSEEPAKPNILSFEWNTLEVTLDFGDGRTQYFDQFVQYLKTYDIKDITTVVNLEVWAKTRNIPCKIKVHQCWNFWSWLYALLLILNRQLQKNGEGLSPKKR